MSTSSTPNVAFLFTQYLIRNWIIFTSSDPRKHTSYVALQSHVRTHGSSEHLIYSGVRSGRGLANAFVNWCGKEKVRV